jgi:hypothetical protein
VPLRCDRAALAMGWGMTSAVIMRVGGVRSFSLAQSCGVSRPRGVEFGRIGFWSGIEGFVRRRCGLLCTPEVADVQRGFLRGIAGPQLKFIIDWCQLEDT